MGYTHLSTFGICIVTGVSSSELLDWQPKAPSWLINGLSLWMRTRVLEKAYPCCSCVIFLCDIQLWPTACYSGPWTWERVAGLISVAKCAHSWLRWPWARQLRRHGHGSRRLPTAPGWCVFPHCASVSDTNWDTEFPYRIKRVYYWFNSAR